MNLISSQFIFSNGKKVIDSPSWLKQDGSCKHECGICDLCGRRFAWGNCSHTAFVSGMDQSGERYKAHMKEYHNN